MKKKRCSRCKEMKTLDQFHKRADGQSGFNTVCKECKRREWREYGQTRESKAQKPADDFKGLVSDQPVVEPGRDCALCKNRFECHRRVMAGLWVLCEIPDQADIYRAADLNLRAERTQMDGETVGEGSASYAD